MLTMPRINRINALYREPPAGQTLRVTLLIGAERGPGWLAVFLGQLHLAEFVELSVFRVTTDVPAVRWSPVDLLFTADQVALGDLRRVLAPVPLLLQQVARGAATLHATRDASGYTSVDAESAGRIADSSPDLLLLVGLPQAAASMADLARQGAWSIGANDSHPLRSGMWLFRDYLKGEPAVYSGVLVHDAGLDQWRLLEPGMCSPTRLSFSRHCAYQLQKAPARLLCAMRRLCLGQAIRAIRFDPGPLPGCVDMLRYWLKAVPQIGQQIAQRWNAPERWYVAIRRSEKPLAPDGADTQWRDYSPLVAPDDRFWADPFLWHEDGRDYVFVESLRDARGRAEIAAIELKPDLSIAAVHEALALETHLSYPFVFRWQNDTYMMVESALSLRVPVFRAEQFPHRWVHAGDALQGWRAVDATLHAHGGRWWLFVSVADTVYNDGGREWDDLYLFYSDSPLGPWEPHAQNPIVRDVRCARSAGPLFEHEGRLIRPGQDCAGEYGRAVMFCEVLQLDTLHYREQVIGTLGHDWAPGLRGCHLYARSGSLEIVDARVAEHRKGGQRGLM